MPIEFPPFIENYLAWWVAGLIVLFGLVIYGFKDLLRFSFKRAWAISSVNFAESIRRRVWLIVLVAIPAVIAVSLLQHPVDEQDAIRQTTKFCLFAAGLVVVLTAIILACTNLPREIESRVIYTIVTKPTTRLEIVVGKVMGFARVSAMILLVMGIFTWAFLQFRAWSLGKYIASRLETPDAVTVIERPTLQYYKEAGLLTARVYERPDDMQVHSRLPVPGDDRRWMAGGGEGMFVVPFAVPREMLTRDDGSDQPVQLGMALFVGYEKVNAPGGEAPDQAQPHEQATTLPYLIQNPDATPEQVRVIAPAGSQPQNAPAVTVEILDRNFNTLIDAKLINDGKPVLLTDPSGHGAVPVIIAPEGANQLIKVPSFIVQVMAGPPQYEYFARQEPVILVNERQQHIKPVPDKSADGGLRPTPPIFRGRTGTFGQQIRGGQQGIVPVALYKFRDAPHQQSGETNVPFEMRIGIERSDADPTEDHPTQLEITFVDRASDSAGSATSTTRAASITIAPETNRTSYFTVPASMIPSKDFNVLIRCLTPGHYVGLQPRSLAMVTADESFAFNLFKSLLVLWLLSLLVVIVSVFSSTFLSWPIAIVLTILILLGRWGVAQLGDATAPGIGNSVVTDLFKPSDPNIAKTISSSVEALSKMLNWVAAILPDITRFSAIEDLERGVAVPMLRLTDSLGVIVVFGLPLLVLAYVFLRGKEVAREAATNKTRRPKCCGGQPPE